MRHIYLVVAVFLLFVGENSVHNFLHLPSLIEESLRSYRRTNLRTDETHYQKRPILAEYDFIVVGSGPGGSVVANRLSENPDWSVLLLEAGREESIVVDVPIFVSYLQFTDFNWGFKAEPQPGACLGMENQQCRWPRGKSLGGTSSINYMIYTRGNKPDYDMWAEDGNTGWSYNDVLPYFLKSENSRMKAFEGSPVHKQGGYLPVEHLRYKSPLQDCFLGAAKEMGYDIIDYNDGRPQRGFAPVQEMMDRGHRASASKTFLKPVKSRPNLHISIKSRVTKVLINPMTKTAEGVEVVRDRIAYTVKARKEVILSAGALNSPQLLMLSGVGPRKHLEELGIPVIQDLPGVGQNLQEHVSYSGLTFLVNETNLGAVEDRLFDPYFTRQFFENGTGPFVVPGGVEGLAYISTKYNDDKRGRPDMELIFASGSLVSDNGRTVRGGMGISDTVYDATFKPVNGRDSWTVWPMLLHPKSKGYIRLKDKNPWHWPKFYANYFQNQQDLDTIVEGIKFSVEMSKTKAFQRYGSYLNYLPVKGCENIEQNSDDYWRCATRTLTTTLHHQSGTCKMGPSTDPEAVVSPELKVHGIKNLRVIDASIIPNLVTAHVTAPTFMIGEKGSDLIKADWKYSGSSHPTQTGSQYPAPNPGSQYPAPNPGSQYPAPSPVSQNPAPNPGSQYPAPNPGSQQPTTNPGSQYPAPVSGPQQPTVNPGSQYPTPNPGSQPTVNPGSQYPSPNPGSQQPTINPGSQYPSPNPGSQQPTVNPGSQYPSPNPGSQQPTTNPGQYPEPIPVPVPVPAESNLNYNYVDSNYYGNNNNYGNNYVKPLPAGNFVY